MPLHMYVTRCMCGGPTGSMPNVQPVSVPSQVYRNPSSGVGSIQASNTQDADPYQCDIRSLFRFLTATVTRIPVRVVLQTVVSMKLVTATRTILRRQLPNSKGPLPLTILARMTKRVRP